MFELEREVRAWSEAVYASRCRSAASVAELSDHLYCEIDRARGEGLPDEQAFAAAVARLGSAGELAAEHAKNRSLLARVCAAEARAVRGGASGRKQATLLIAHAILWAIVMLATAFVMKRNGGAQAAQSTILLILIPCWLGSEQILRLALANGSRKRAR